MAITKNEKNKKLDAAPTGEPMTAVTALRKLKNKAKYSMVYSRDGKPELPHGGVKYHLQGVSVYVGTARRRNRVILSTSADKGKLIMGIATPDKRHYTVEAEPIGYETEEKVHPGGIQVIGQYVVIPIYYKGYKGIEIRNIMDGLNIVKEFSIKNKPYCVGITTTGENSSEYYVLAAVTKPDGSRVDVYTTEPGYKLSDSQCTFTHFGSYRLKSNETRWNRYSNNISLLSDTDSNIYFLGFYNTDRVFGYGIDIADLHQMELKETNTVTFKRLGEFVAERKNGSFRFGAGATVLNASSIQIYSCERNGQKDLSIGMDSIDCDLYHEW
ncbi:MAG: hypothetical protein IH964_06590 [Candidatus Dadabacteria bacterium]|nr:hypothetical protein [Candidatus Dadabacteria bacterium]